MEWLFLIAVDVATRMYYLSWIDTIDALQPFGHWAHVSAAPYFHLGMIQVEPCVY